MSDSSTSNPGLVRMFMNDHTNKVIIFSSLRILMIVFLTNKLIIFTPENDSMVDKSTSTRSLNLGTHMRDHLISAASHYFSATMVLL